MLDTESAQALGRDFDPRQFRAEQDRPSRRRFLTWGGAAAASVAAGGVLVSMMAAGDVQATAVGEVRLAPLADGSTVTLNTNSRVVIRIDQHRREVEMTQGEAYFSIAQDAERPFVVKVGGRSLQSNGGAFAVHRLDAERSEIVVQSGRLRLDQGSPDLPMTVNARVTLGQDGLTHVAALAGRDIDRALAWREGKLAFEGESLAEAAAAFARYGGPRIIIADPDLAREPITGLYAANDPAGFSRATALALGAAVERKREGLVMVW